MKYEVTFWGRNIHTVIGSPEEFQALGNIEVEGEDEEGALAIAEQEASRRYSEKVLIEMSGNIIEL
jgi:hypothetical protein